MHNVFFSVFPHLSPVETMCRVFNFAAYLVVSSKSCFLNAGCHFLVHWCRYGASTGAPTEVNIYSDVDAAWHCLTDRYGVTPETVVLYGQSIGTVPTVDLASRVKVAGVVLHSPLTSGVRVAFPDTKQTWFFDAFPRLVSN